jgi:hypothetical protein
MDCQQYYTIHVQCFRFQFNVSLFGGVRGQGMKACAAAICILVLGFAVAPQPAFVTIFMFK